MIRRQPSPRHRADRLARRNPSVVGARPSPAAIVVPRPKAELDVEQLRKSACDARIAAGAATLQKRDIGGTALSLLLQEKSATPAKPRSAAPTVGSSSFTSDGPVAALRRIGLHVSDEEGLLKTLTRAHRTIDVTGVDEEKQQLVRDMMAAAIVERKLLAEGHARRGLATKIGEALDLGDDAIRGFDRITRFGMLENLIDEAAEGAANTGRVTRSYERTAKRIGVPASILFECSLMLCRRDVMGTLAPQVSKYPIGAYAPIRAVFVSLLNQDGTLKNGARARAALSRFELAGAENADAFSQHTYFRGDQVIAPLKALGPQFAELAADVGIAHRLDEFVVFVKENKLTNANAWDARLAFSNALGTREVFRGMTLTQNDLDNIAAAGIMSHVIRGGWREGDDPLNSQLSLHIQGRDMHRSNLVSTTSIEDFARAISLPKRDRREDAEPYLFRVNVPVLDLVDACGETAATKGIDAIVRRMAQLRLEIESPDGKTRKFAFDETVETMTTHLLGADEVVDVVKLDRLQLPKWRQAEMAETTRQVVR